MNRCNGGPGRGRQVATNGDRPVLFDQAQGAFQHAAQVLPGLLPRAAFDRRHDQVCPLRPPTMPGSPVKFAALPPDHVALTGQHVQDAIAGRRHDLQGEVHAQQPGNVVHFVAAIRDGVRCR